MGRPKKEQTDHTRNIVLSYIRENVDEDGYTKMNISSVSMDRGISYSSVKNALKSLAVDGKIEYTNTDDVIDQSGRVNRGFLVHLIGNVQPLIVPVKVEAPVRKCEKCGTDAPAVGARFCWKCGASLLTEKELLKEAYDRVLPKIAKLGTDSTEMNEIMTIIGKVANMAFKEVVA